MQNKTPQDNIPLKDVGSSEENPQYGGKLEFRRWIILIAYSLYSCNAAIAWLTYTPVLKASKDYFHTEEEDILEFGDAILYSFFLFALPISYLSYKHFRSTILINMAMECLGGWIRYFSKGNYGMSIVGQWIIAINTSPVFA